MPQKLRNLVSDWMFRLAFIAALLFWAVLYCFDSPQLSVDWIVAAPWLFVSLIVVQPLLEEIVFRGGLQSWLSGQGRGYQPTFGLTSANLITSLIFVTMHLFYHSPLMAILVFIPSLIFGYFRDRYDGWLVPSILLHCFYNAGYFLLYAPSTNQF